MVLWHGWSCKEMCGATLWVSKQDDSTTLQGIHSLASMTTTSKKKKWNLLENCEESALKLFWNAYTWHELVDLIFYGQWINLRDRLQNGPKLVTNAWNNWYLTFIKHANTNRIATWAVLQNNAGRDCFKIPTLQDLEDSKSTSGGALCVFGCHTFVPISWMCKKQTSISHSSTQSEIISLDAGLRLDGIPALDLWDLIVFVLWNTIQTPDRTEQPVVNCGKDHGPNKRSQGMINVLNNIDCVPSNVQFSHQEALLYVFDDNEAVIKMIIKGRSPSMRHVSRTPRVALDGLFDRINLDPKIQIKYIDTQEPTRRHTDEGKFHKWRMESPVVCSIAAISVLQFVLKRWRKDHNKIQEKNESQRNRDQWWALLQGRLRTYHPRRQKARWREAMEIKIPQMRKLRERIERGNPLWAATQKPRLTIIMNNLWEALSQHATQSGMITKLGLLKSGKLTLGCLIDRSNPLWPLGERHASPNQVSFLRRPSTMEQRNQLWKR